MDYEWVQGQGYFVKGSAEQVGAIWADAMGTRITACVMGQDLNLLKENCLDAQEARGWVEAMVAVKDKYPGALTVQMHVKVPKF